MVLHGCGVNAYDMVINYAGFAQNNNMVMVFPQAVECWENGRAEFTDTDYLTKNGFQLQFLKKVIDKIDEPLDPDFDYSTEVSDEHPRVMELDSYQRLAQKSWGDQEEDSKWSEETEEP